MNVPYAARTTSTFSADMAAPLGSVADGQAWEAERPRDPVSLRRCALRPSLHRQPTTQGLAKHQPIGYFLDGRHGRISAAASSSSGVRTSRLAREVPVDDSWSRRLTTPCAAQWSNELGRSRPNLRTRRDPVALRSPGRVPLVDPVSGNRLRPKRP
jgi:hypothetical protein